jgi:hypothetical protein
MNCGQLPVVIEVKRSGATRLNDDRQRQRLRVGVLNESQILRDAVVGEEEVVSGEFEDYLADVYTTDTHDLETMMLRTTAYLRVLLRYDFCPVGTVEVGLEQFQLRASELMTDLQAVARRVGYLRWIAIRNSLKIRFSEVSLRRCLDSGCLRINEERLEIEIILFEPMVVRKMLAAACKYHPTT